MDAGGNLSNTVTADSTESAPDTDTLEHPDQPGAGVEPRQAGVAVDLRRGRRRDLVQLHGDEHGQRDAVGSHGHRRQGLGDAVRRRRLLPGASITCTASHTITQADLDAGSITNVATASSGALASNQDTATVNAVQSPVLRVVKSSTPVGDGCGQVVPYTFTVTNTGNVTLTGVTVSDPKCDSGPSGPSGDTNSDSKLQLSETWVYTCSHTVTQAEMDAGGNLATR